MLGLKLIHISKRGHRWRKYVLVNYVIIISVLKVFKKSVG